MCKVSLRLATEAYDAMLSNLITAAKADISEACDSVFDPDNENECNAVILYVKGQFPFQPDEKSWNLYQQRLSVIGTRKIGVES